MSRAGWTPLRPIRSSPRASTPRSSAGSSTILARCHEGLEGQYQIARLRGLAVAGIGQAPSSLTTAVWSTHICVDNLEETITRAVRAGGAVLIGPLEADSDGRQALLADPDKVAFCVWQPGDRAGAQLVNEPGAWAMSALHAPRRERAEAFYTTVFGWKLEAHPHAPAML